MRLSCYLDRLVLGVVFPIVAIVSLSAARGADRPAVSNVEGAGFLGATLRELAPFERSVLVNDNDDAPRIVVTGVFPDSPAEAAEMRRGDVLEQLAGQPVKSAAELNKILSGYFAGDVVELVYSRRGDRWRAKVKLASAPENVNVVIFDLASRGLAWAQLDVAGKYQRGDGAKQDLVKARYWFSKAAEQGLAEAQVSLAAMFERGEGGEAVLEQARHWYEKAAESGLSDAQFGLGLMYCDGRGLAKNDDLGLRWLNKAAVQGHAEAQFTLGCRLQLGQGAAKNERAAFGWFLKAAEAGHHSAQFQLAEMYAAGVGARQDWAQAFRWCQASARSGNAAAQDMLGSMYYHGFGVAANRRAAVTCFHAAAAQGSSDAQLHLGSMYLDLSPPKYASALEWIRKAADQGHAVAIVSMAAMYAEGLGVEKNDKEAFRLFHLAAKAGQAEAQWAVGRYCCDGGVVRRNYMVALQWFRLAANQGMAEAQYAIGYLFANGWGVAKDRHEAMNWYHKAAQQGYAPAEGVLGWMAMESKSYKIAAGWLRRAADKGDADAQNNLGCLYDNGWGVAANRVEAIAWYLLTGRAAFSGETVMERLLAHREQPIPSLQAACASVTPALEAVFTKMVAKKMEKRFQSMSEVVAELERIHLAQDAPAQPAVRNTRSVGDSQGEDLRANEFLLDTKSLSPASGRASVKPATVRNPNSSQVVEETLALERPEIDTNPKTEPSLVVPAAGST